MVNRTATGEGVRTTAPSGAAAPPGATALFHSTSEPLGAGSLAGTANRVPQPITTGNGTAPGAEPEEPKAAPSDATELPGVDVGSNESTPGTEDALLQVTSTNTRLCVCARKCVCVCARVRVCVCTCVFVCVRVWCGCVTSCI